MNRKPRKKFRVKIITRIWLPRIFTILILILLAIIFISKNFSITTETHGTQGFIYNIISDPQILLFFLVYCIVLTFYSFVCPDLLVDKEHVEYETVNAVVVDKGFSDDYVPYVVLSYEGFQRKVASRYHNIGDTVEIQMTYRYNSEGDLYSQYFVIPE